MASVNIGKYKNEIMSDIINTPTIVKAIDSKSPDYNPECPDSLINVNIFPYFKILDTQKITDTYILIAVDKNKILRSNNTFNEIIIYIRVMCHKNNMNAPYFATRIDYIGDELQKLFEGQVKYGYKELKLMSDKERIWDDTYLYRELVFVTNDLRERQGA